MVEHRVVKQTDGSVSFINEARESPYESPPQCSGQGLFFIAKAKDSGKEVRGRLSGHREAPKTPWRSRGDCFVTGFLATTFLAGETSGLTSLNPSHFIDSRAEFD